MEFIKSLITDAGALIAIYAPVVLAYITQIIDWVITYKKYAKLNVQKQVAPLLAEVKELKDQLKKVSEDNDKLAEINNQLMTSIACSQEDMKKAIEDQTKILNEVVQENIKLRADLRRKTDDKSNEAI